MSVAVCRPKMVSRVNDDGRNAWAKRIRRSGTPFALAVVMKFSWSVEIMSALSTRMLVAANPSARAMVGKAIDLK